MLLMALFQIFHDVSAHYVYYTVWCLVGNGGMEFIVVPIYSPTIVPITHSLLRTRQCSSSGEVSVRPGSVLAFLFLADLCLAIFCQNCDSSCCHDCLWACPLSFQLLASLRSPPFRPRLRSLTSPCLSFVFSLPLSHSLALLSATLLAASARR